ncbi:DUF5615 family PIN-like protein [Pseudomonas japonica]|uniref:DUF5615 family PIN-like protein n=1 Tax=Pseudomonas japonica TaxID=256466 RepID=UPI000A04FF1C|nr:DUF5615 family PIN-like protein [Pseudomonas japonica]
MAYSFLIDECLSPQLAQLAHVSGHAATSVRDRGWCGLSDREIMRRAVEFDLTLVTNNSVDFRGGNPPASGGLFALEELHAGLVCLNSAVGLMTRDIQKLAFTVLLQRLPADLVNRAIEVTAQRGGRFTLVEYAIPMN